MPKIKVKAFMNAVINIERFNSAQEVVKASASRTITDSRFRDMSKPGQVNPKFTSVSSLDEALEIMRTGYQPAVESLKTANSGLSGQGKRINFHNDVVGFAPVVPLALIGVPQSMINMSVKPIKSKVIDVYYSMTASAGTSTETIIENGKRLLSAIMSLEHQGYRINLYAVQDYYNEEKGADMLVIKIKSSNTPLDLKRMSFALMHPAFFRVIGFDWYSKTPNGQHRWCYGHALGYDFSDETMQNGFKEMFGQNAVVFSCAKLSKDREHLETVMKGGDK